MISFLDNISKIFLDKNINNIIENENEFSFSISDIRTDIPSKEDFEKSLLINDRDIINIKLICEGDTEFTYESIKNNFIEFYNKFEEFSESDLNIELSFNVIKSSKNNKISIYNKEIFYDYLIKKNIIDFYKLIDKILVENYIIFEIQESNNGKRLLETANIFFKYLNEDCISYIRDLKKYEKSKAVVYSSYLNSYKILPEDFLVLIPSDNHKLNSKFNLLSKLLSIGYLFDITDLTLDKFEYKLNGYKPIKKSYNNIDLNENSFNTFFNIYNWVYVGGNLYDKIGIARNIISLNLEKNFTEINETVLSSIKSGFNVYEKENLKQYVDIRNKISDQLWDFQAKADKISENFVSDLKKNIFALVSFFASVIILKVLSSKEKIIISDGTFLIMLGFLVISYFILYYSNWEANEQKKRFINFYLSVKERYTDILDKNDINKILNNDKEFIANKIFISKKIKYYSWIWSVFIITFAIVTFLLNLFEL